MIEIVGRCNECGGVFGSFDAWFKHPCVADGDADGGSVLDAEAAEFEYSPGGVGM